MNLAKTSVTTRQIVTSVQNLQERLEWLGDMNTKVQVVAQPRKLVKHFVPILQTLKSVSSLLLPMEEALVAPVAVLTKLLVRHTARKIHQPAKALADREIPQSIAQKRPVVLGLGQLVSVQLQQGQRHMPRQPLIQRLSVQSNQAAPGQAALVSVRAPPAPREQRVLLIQRLSVQSKVVVRGRVQLVSVRLFKGQAPKVYSKNFLSTFSPNNLL